MRDPNPNHTEREKLGQFHSFFITLTLTSSKVNETKQAGKVNATEQQILFWFRNRRRENKIKRDPNYCDGDSSEISDGGGIWITDTPPPKPQTRNLFEEIDEHDNMNNVISHEDESQDNPSETEFGWRPRLKPSKEQLGWKVMTNLDDIKLIEQFYVCDICELRNGFIIAHLANHWKFFESCKVLARISFIFEENLDRHQCDDIIL